MKTLFEAGEELSFDEWLDRLSEQDQKRFGAYCLEEQYIGGETIVYEGNPGDTLYIVKEGIVEISKSTTGDNEEWVSFVELSGGSIFGEMSMITDRPASATVVAKNTVTVDVLPRNEFDMLRQVEPDLACKVDQFLLTTVIHRLDQMDQVVTRLIDRMNDPEETT